MLLTLCWGIQWSVTCRDRSMGIRRTLVVRHLGRKMADKIGELTAWEGPTPLLRHRQLLHPVCHYAMEGLDPFK